MSLKSKLTALERGAAKAAAGPTAQADREQHAAACREWETAFIAGRVLPLPARPELSGHTAESLRASLAWSACVTARADRAIGPLGYLGGMTADERRAADSFCGTMYAAEQLADEGPSDFPEWGRLAEVEGEMVRT